jgi:hypothetical protein
MGGFQRERRPESGACRLERNLLIDLDEVAIWIAKVEAAHTPVGTVVRWIHERCTSGIECLLHCVNIGDRDDYGCAILAFGICWLLRSRGALGHKLTLEQSDLRVTNGEVGVDPGLIPEVGSEAEDVAIEPEAGWKAGN